MALTAHITSSVGWLGAVAGFLALAIAGLTARDVDTARAIDLAMESTGWFVLVPFAISLVTGPVPPLGTSLGCFRHYWVVVNLVITVFATVILLLYMQMLGHLADVAADGGAARSDVSDLRDPSPLLHPAAALVLLPTATTFAVHRPPRDEALRLAQAAGAAGRTPRVGPPWGSTARPSGRDRVSRPRASSLARPL